MKIPSSSRGKWLNTNSSLKSYFKNDVLLHQSYSAGDKGLFHGQNPAAFGEDLGLEGVTGLRAFNRA